MAESQKTDEAAGAAGEQKAPTLSAERKPSPKTMQELERLQFDELDRAAFDKR